METLVDEGFYLRRHLFFLKLQSLVYLLKGFSEVPVGEVINLLF